MKFEVVYNDLAVQQVTHYIMGTPSNRKENCKWYYRLKWVLFYEKINVILSKNIFDLSEW